MDILQFSLSLSASPAPSLYVWISECVSFCIITIRITMALNFSDLPEHIISAIYDFFFMPTSLFVDCVAVNFCVVAVFVATATAIAVLLRFASR